MNILLVFFKIIYAHPSSKKDCDIFTKIFGEIVSLTLPQVAASTPEEHNVQIAVKNDEN